MIRDKIPRSVGWKKIFRSGENLPAFGTVTVRGKRYPKAREVERELETLEATLRWTLSVGMR